MAALSRTPSPAAGSGSDSDSVVATPMTPRTKLRELFATIDGGNAGDSSGSDHERESNQENKTPSRKAKKTSAKLSARKSPRLADTSAFAGVQAAATSSTSPLQTRSTSRSPRAASPLVRAGGLPASSDEDSDIEVRPRGRFAARMQASAAAHNTAATTEPLADNARDRVKKLLQQAADAEKQPEEAKSHEDTTNDAEDEEDAPVAARPRKRLTNLRTARRSASASPRQSATPTRSTREDSPPMFMTPSKQAARQESPDMFMTPEKGGDDDSGAATPGRKARFQMLVARKREEARAREEAEERKRAARLAAMADNSDNDDDDEAMGGLDEDDDLLMRDAEGADDNPSDITDDEGGRRLTQKMAGARPERKASKKALEEMHRETQRMARNLQLAHEAKTRKKVTKASLFERFNFHPTGSAAAAATAAAASTAPAAKEPASSSRPTSPASPHNNTDTEMRADADTPPSSPPVPAMPDAPFDKAKEAAVTTTLEPADAAITLPRLDKGKGKAVETFVVDEQPKLEPKRNIRIRMPIVQQTNLVMFDSDDDGELEIVQTTKNKLDILFDNVPLKRNQEPRSMFALRRLAQIGSPGKKPRARPSAKGAKNASGAGDLTLSELQQSLQDRARRQAKLEREERLDILRAKGVRIQTEEEREREMEEVDDIVARARQEAEELMQRERDEAKKEKKGDDTDAVPDVLDWDESEDEDDYVPEEEEEVEEREIELSGSEDEEEEQDGDEEVLAGTLIDGEAESTDNDSEDGKDEEEEKDAGNAAKVLPTPTRPRPAKRRAALIISDDEDEGDDSNNTPTAAKPLSLAFEAKTPGPKTAFAKSPSGLIANNDSPQVPTSVLRSATKAFIPGLPVAVGGPAGLGLTQIFAGTMTDDSQMAGSPGGFGSPSQFMPTLGNFVDADFSQAADSGDKTNAAAVLDSQQTQEWVKRLQGGGSNATDSNNNNNNGGTGPSQMVQFDFSQSQAHGLESLLREPDVSQISLLGPSQDAGPQDYTPLKVRFIEHQPSTIETVIMGGELTQPLTQSQAQSQLPIPSPPPIAPRRPRGRLFRKTDVAKIVEEEEEEEAADAEDEEEEAEPTDEQAMEAATAFAKMRQAALQKQFDRKKSKAKEMIEEQAEESEDEYAGLGGADGEDSDNESLASVKDIIDDDQKVSSTDNAKLAAFYAYVFPGGNKKRKREHLLTDQ